MNTGDRLIRWAAALAVIIVTAIATVISYSHAHELVLHHGESGRTAAALPLTVDGLIATCSLVVLDCARRDRKAPWHAWALLIAGVVATLGANISHGLSEGWVGAIVAAWPALVAVGSFELLIRLVRDGRVAGTHVPVGEAVPAEVPELLPADETAVLVPDPHQVRAASVFAEDLDRGEVPSIRAIKSALRIGQPRAKEVRDYLSVLASQ